MEGSANMAFEWQDGRELRSRTVLDEPYVSIGGGRMYFNADATKLLGADVEWIKIGIDSEKGLVAVKPLNEKEPGALPLKQSGGSKNSYLGRQLNSKQLVSKMVGAIKSTKRYSVDSPEKYDDLLIIDLNKEIS